MTALERAIAQPQPVRAFGATSPLDGLDRRSVGFADVLAQSVSAVAPSAAATTVVVLVAGVSVPAVVISILIAGLLSLLVARTICQFARRLASSGSIYTYTAQGLGPTAGLAAGAAILVGYGVVAMFALFGGAYYLTFLLQAAWPSLPSAVATLVSLVGEVLVLAVVLVRGIRVSTRVALVVEAISVVIISALLVVLLVRIGPISPGILFPLGDVSLGAIAAGAVIAMTAFVGFESAATLGVEARTPLRTVPRAIVWTVILSLALYALAAVTQVAGFASLGRDLSSSSSPVNELAVAFGLGGWGTLADVGIAASFLACAIASTTALSRVLFTMGREGVVPAALGRTHRRFGTPIGAIAVSVPVITLVPLIAVAAGADLWGAMQATIAIAAAGYIVAYVLVCVAAPFFLRRIGELTIGAAATAGVSALALAGALVAYFVVEGLSGNPGVWISLFLGIAATGLICWRRRHGAIDVAAVGAYDEPVAAHVLGGVPRLDPEHPTSRAGGGG